VILSTVVIFLTEENVIEIWLKIEGKPTSSNIFGPASAFAQRRC